MPLVSKKKAGKRFEKTLWDKGNPHLCVPPLSSLWLEIHPFVALWKDKGVSPSAEGDKGSAPLTAPPFEKGGQKLSHAVALNCLTNQNLKPLLILTNKKIRRIFSADFLFVCGF